MNHNQDASFHRRGHCDVLKIRHVAQEHSEVMPLGANPTVSSHREAISPTCIRRSQSESVSMPGVRQFLETSLQPRLHLTEFAGVDRHLPKRPIICVARQMLAYRLEGVR
jgi:hypothetical protein